MRKKLTPQTTMMTMLTNRDSQWKEISLLPRSGIRFHGKRIGASDGSGIYTTTPSLYVATSSPTMLQRASTAACTSSLRGELTRKR